MKHIKSIELLKEFRKIQPFTLNFKDGLNVIVGENGSGKSSILELLTKESQVIAKIDYTPGSEYRFFDTEKCNPRIKSDISNSKSIVFDLNSRFMSHGEALLSLLSASKSFKNVALIIDEPEAGISLKNQKKLLEIFKNCIKNGCQLIIATHSYIFIKGVEEVFDMGSKKWVLSEEFLR